MEMFHLSSDMPNMYIGMFFFFFYQKTISKEFTSFTSLMKNLLMDKTEIILILLNVMKLS